MPLDDHYHIMCTLWLCSYGNSSGYIHVAEDMCNGGESSLLECNRMLFTSQLCDHSQNVGLECGKNVCVCVRERERERETDCLNL